MWLELNSGAIHAVKYEGEKKLLHVWFRDGTTIIYHGVPIKTYDALLIAPSAGKYFNEHIRNDFKFERD